MDLDKSQGTLSNAVSPLDYLSTGEQSSYEDFKHFSKYSFGNPPIQRLIALQIDGCLAIVVIDLLYWQ